MSSIREFEHAVGKAVIQYNQRVAEINSNHLRELEEAQQVLEAEIGGQVTQFRGDEAAMKSVPRMRDLERGEVGGYPKERD